MTLELWNQLAGWFLGVIVTAVLGWVGKQIKDWVLMLVEVNKHVLFIRHHMMMRRDPMDRRREVLEFLGEERREDSDRRADGWPTKGE